MAMSAPALHQDGFQGLRLPTEIYSSLSSISSHEKSGIMALWECYMNTFKPLPASK